MNWQEHPAVKAMLEKEPEFDDNDEDFEPDPDSEGPTLMDAFSEMKDKIHTAFGHGEL